MRVVSQLEHDVLVDGDRPTYLSGEWELGRRAERGPCAPAGEDGTIVAKA